VFYNFTWDPFYIWYFGFWTQGWGYSLGSGGAQTGGKVLSYWTATGVAVGAIPHQPTPAPSTASITIPSPAVSISIPSVVVTRTPAPTPAVAVTVPVPAPTPVP